MYAFLDKFFFVFHTGLIIFILFGWIWRPLRKPHLLTVGAVFFCWFILGIWYGFGYCPCTDWHWEVRRHLGHYDMPPSYTKFLFDKLTGLDANATAVDTVTVTLYFASLAGSIYVNIRGRRAL